MSWAVSGAAAFAAGQEAEAPIHWYRADPSALDQLTPEGVAEEPHDARWTIHPDGLWILGNHPAATPQQLQQLTEMLQQERAAFAYSMSDLPGYTGLLGPIHSFIHCYTCSNTL